MARLQELERAARDVIQNVKQIQDLRHARLSVIGGLALWHYLPEYRSTDNINFITNISTSPSSLKKRLLERPGSPFFQRSQALFYKSPRGQEIRIDISPEWLSPYLPESAAKVQEISSSEIPYISLTDLIVFKLDSSGLRSNPVKKERDARDAAALVSLAANEGTIQLSEKQEQVVEEALCDVAKCGTKEKGWWEHQMGLGKPSEERGTVSQRKGRPHSKSDPSPSRTPISNDPNAAWHYERLDHAHVRQFNSLHSSRNSNRPGLGRSSSHRLIRDTGLTMTQPKTTQGGMKRSGLSNEIKADSDHDNDQNDQYYTIEPGSSSERGSQGGYFDLHPHTPPGGLGTVTERKCVGLRRTSKVDYFDISPGDAPSTVVQVGRPPLKDHRSVSFIL
ncbi:uncharacterized protein F4822DRAFT_213976 [Hypoxylon trugodes]|uniref:uncharacterized protein n=1 Tax=Hypoxylon trugodes TaxID=326681 RepID=UPI0021928047|nr:uncharacterized protein F4822DRAFT_213976 [Hypoxylon trugodes]KAI1389794.1 hypothetical protein F4822DRAFT_213976 [Hypoxylon trugodes]